MTAVILGAMRRTAVIWLLVLALSPAMAEEMRDAADLAREAGYPTQVEKQELHRSSLHRYHRK